MESRASWARMPGSVSSSSRRESPLVADVTIPSWASRAGDTCRRQDSRSRNPFRDSPGSGSRLRPRGRLFTGGRSGAVIVEDRVPGAALLLRPRRRDVVGGDVRDLARVRVEVIEVAQADGG